MTTVKRLVMILSMPLAFLMLVTGLSPIPRMKHDLLEEAVEAEIAGEFTPVFRFAVASDVHINAGDDIPVRRGVRRAYQRRRRHHRETAGQTV